jgi:hypothetical protein
VAERDSAIDVFLRQSSADASLLRDTVEAPAESPSSLEENDRSDTVQPTFSNAQWATTSDSDESESVEKPDSEDETASESIVAPWLAPDQLMLALASARCAG